MLVKWPQPKHVKLNSNLCVTQVKHNKITDNCNNNIIAQQTTVLSSYLKLIGK